MALLRILRCVITTDYHVIELISLHGFQVLAELAEREKQPALTSQIMSVFKTYSEHHLMSGATGSLVPGGDLAGGHQLTPHRSGANRLRNHSVSSTGSGTQRVGSGLKAHNLHHHSAAYNASLNAAVAAAAEEAEGELEGESMAAKGFNLAVNVVSELLKFSPLTSSWLYPDGDGLKLKDLLQGPGGASLNEELTRLAGVPQSLAILTKEHSRSERLLHSVKSKQNLVMSTSAHKLSVDTSCGGLDSPSFYPPKPRSASRASTSSSSQAHGETVRGRQLSQCSLSDGEGSEDDIDAPQDTLIRDQMRRQGMTTLVLMSVTQATCPSEVLETLSTLETLLLRNPAAQREFQLVGGYSRLFDMLVRVEENLALLVPCRDMSLAAASGAHSNRSSRSLVQPHSHAHSSSPSMQQHEASPEGKGSLYHSQAGSAGDFDSYYSSLLMVVLNVVFDEGSCSPLGHVSHKPMLPKQGLVAANLDALSLVVGMLFSGQYSFVAVAIKLVYALLQSSPRNVVALERTGVCAALMKVLMAIVFSCGQDPACLQSERGESPAVFTSRTAETTESVPTNGNDAVGSHSINKNLLQIALDIVLVLQMVGVATSLRDSSVLAVLTALATAASQTVTDAAENNSGVLSTVKCHNCELEAASLECLHDGCICDKFFRLCHECDKVFHKSALKRSHIRLPVVHHMCSNPRIILSADNVEQTSESVGQKINSLVKDGLSVDVCQSLLFGAMNGYSRTALAQCGLTSTKTVALNCNGSDIDLFEFLTFKERVISVLLIGVRGLLDDRKARSQSLPYEIFPSLLLCMRRLVIDPFQTWTAQDSLAQNNSSEASLFADLMDHRGDLLTPHTEIINKHNKHGDQYQQPPELCHNSPRRVRLSLLAQTVARFVVSDSLQDKLANMVVANPLLREDCLPGPAMTGKKLLSCIDLVKSFGVDAIFVHALVDSGTSFTHLTTIDKQYVVWLMRECVVSANRLKPDRATRFLEWYLWLLRSEVVASSGTKFVGAKTDSRGASAARLNVALSAAVKGTTRGIATHHNSYTEYSMTALPSANPKIPVLIRLLVLQELRLLMAGDDVHAHKKSDLYSQVLPSACNLWAIPFAASMTDSYSSRSTSLDLEGGERPSGYSQQSARSVAGGGYNQMKTLNSYSTSCNVPMRNSSVKVVLSQLGFLEVLTELVMGDMCSRQVAELLDSAPKPFFGKNSSAMGGPVSQLSDLDKEDWWAALATLGQLLACCDAAKDSLDRYFGLQRFVRFLLPLMHFASANMAHSHDHGVHYSAVIVGLVFELSVSSGRFSAPTKPFIMALPRFPVQQVYQAKSSGRELRGASPRVQRKSFNNNKSDSPAFDTSSGVFGLGLLFSRPCICNVRPCTDSLTDHSNDVLYSMSPSQGVAGTTALCPVYFTHERTVALIVSTVRAFPLTMTSESFRSSFVNGNSSWSNVAGGALFPASGHQRSRSGTSTKMPAGSFSGRPLSMCSQLSTDLLDSAHHPAGGGISLSRKLMLKNMSSASIQSLESDVHRWELDSVGRGSSTHGDLTGRASFHSHQSLVTLAHALKSGTHTTTTLSVNNDGASVLGNYLKSLKTIDDAEEGDNRHGSSHGFAHSVDLSPSRSAKSRVEVEDSFPFPPTLGGVSESSTPLVYFPFLHALDSGLSHYASNVLVLLHHALLIRSGMSEDEREDVLWQDDASVVNGSHSAATVIKADQIALYRQVLRKHLAMLLPPSYHYPSWNTHCDVWQPPVSHLQIRSAECGELLLAVAMVSPHDIQTFVLSSLSDLLDGNPANSFLFAHSESTCVSLTRLIPSLQEGLREAVGYIVSQILRYSVQVNALNELISSVSKDATAAMVLARTASSTAELFEVIHEEDCDAAFNRNILYVMGRTAERVCPAAFLSFDNGSPFESRVELPSIPSLLTSAFNLSVCAWIRIGAMRGAAASSFVQMSCKQSDLLVDMYFRVVYKLAPIVEPAGAKSFSFSHLADEQEESAKKTIQLCISFGKSVQPNTAQHQATDGFQSGSSSVKSGAQDMKDVSNAALAQARADRMRQAAEQPTGHSHWDLAVNQLMGLDEQQATCEADAAPLRAGGLTSSDDITDRTVRQALSTLSSAITRYSVPDVIVEFDWSELGDWHLLAVSLTAHVVCCSVDGRRVPVLHWSPLGYQYDEQSAAMKSTAHGQPVPLFDRDKSPIAAVRAPTLSLPQPPRVFVDSKVVITKDDPLRVSLGGLLYEAKAFDLVDKHVYSSMNQAFYHTSSTHSWLLESSAQRASSLLLAFSSLLCGFSGSVGELVVTDGPVDEAHLRNCLRDGPAAGLREIKTARLACISAAAMPVAAASSAPTMSLIAPKPVDSKAAPLLQFPLMRPSSPPVLNANTTDSSISESGLNIFSSQTYPSAAVVTDPFAKTRGKDKESTSLITFSNSVQIHHTNAVLDAVTALGGLRVLFPLMISDKARLIAALRVMGCIVTSSKEAYSEFKAQHVDKAILYCCKAYSHLVTLETVQVLFELVSFSNGSSSFGTAAHSSSDSERIVRTSVLELLIDVVASSGTEFQLARSAVDWLREICDDHVDNCQTYLKTVGLVPVLVILSVWGLGAACSFPVAAVKSKAAEVTVVTPQPRVRLHTEQRSEGSTVVSPNYKPVELSRKPSAGDAKFVENETQQRDGWERSASTAQQVSSAEKFKLQLACFRLLKLLVCGTTGDLTQRASLSQSQTVTGFSAANLVSLLNFAVSSACRTRSESSSRRDTSRRQDHVRYSSQYVGMPLLSQIDFGSSDYWLYAGAVAALDAVLVLVNGPLECTVINMLRLAYPASGLWHVILSLMGSACVEVRQRAIALLVLSFSSSDGKMDVRQVALFDRMHGFQTMADLLASHENACTDSILEALFSLVYWSSKVRASDLVSDSVAREAEVVQPHSDARTADEGRVRASSLDGLRRDGVNNAANSGMMSMFVWSNNPPDSKPIPAPSKDLLIALPESAASSTSPDSTKSLHAPLAEFQMAPGVTLKAVDTSLGPALGEKRLSSPRDSLLLFVGEGGASHIPNRGSPVASTHSHKSLSNSSNEEDGDSLAARQNDSADQAKTTLLNDVIAEKAAAFETIQVPQAVEVLVRVLQGAKAVEQVTLSFARLENCVTLPSATQHSSVRSRTERKDSTNSVSNGNTNKSDVDSVNRNAEAIFGQKDWLLWLCDSLLIYRRRMLNGEELDGPNSSVFSLSESESVGGGGGGNDLDLSEAESEDCGSVGGDSEDSSSVNNSVNGRQRTGSRSQAWQQHMITQFTCPVFNFIRRLLTLDLKAKYASVRRWNEVLRLSLPETYDVQEAILLDLIETLRSLSVLAEGVETTIHYLRNMGAMLEQVLEKADMSLMFAMKVVQALHSLSYQCPPEVRGRIKETCLPEMRRSYVVRCLLDHSQSLHTRAVALNEICSPLQGYLSGAESKTLTDFQVVVVVL
eukprot:gene23689-29934_t